MAEFEFETNTQRYRYTTGDRAGQFVSRQRIEQLTEDYIEQQKDRMNELTQQLLSHDINVPTFVNEFAQRLKLIRINTYGIGRGGVGRLTQQDYGIIGRGLQDEYARLHTFGLAILDGQLTVAQIQARAKQYENSLWMVYERGREVSHQADGFNWERNVRNPTAESCADCIRFEDMGWVPIGTIPAIGRGRECGPSDRCHKEYSRATEQPENSRWSSLSHSLSFAVKAPSPTYAVSKRST